MNTKKLTLTIIFAALTVALNPAISRVGVPAPYAPFLIYGLWEIPIVVAFLLIGPKSGIAISILNTLALFAFYPGSLPTGPFYNFAAIASMLLGVYIAQKLCAQGVMKNKKTTIAVILATTLGIVFREIVMTLINYVTLRQSYPFGYNMPELGVLGFLPLGALFNGTVVLYTLPVAYTIAKLIQKNIRLNLN